jgi:zinc transporter, ZIP family
MNEFLLVFGIAVFASFLTYLGAPLAEWFDVPHIVVSGALQFSAGIITALVAFSLMPSVVRYSTPIGAVLGFFAGGAIFVAIDYFSAKRAAQNPSPDSGAASMGLYIGILVDLVIDGVVIGIGSTLTLATGLLLALGLAVSTAPLTFVTTATAKRQGIPKRRRQLLGILSFLAVLGGAMLGFLVLRNQPLETRLILIALASGFLITTVAQTMIPEANRDGEPSFAAIMYVGGLSLYAFVTLSFG